MSDAVMHPTSQELTAFGLGKLPEHAAAVVAAHLEKCHPCRQVVADLSPDSFLNRVRAAGPAGSSFPPSLAQPGNTPQSAGQPAIPVVACPNVPPELARHPKYLILRELGRGGMGVVYQARQTMMDRQVVIKVINRSLIEQPGALERFHREIRAAAQLSHPNIVTAYDAEQAGDLHMLVMEFVPGQSLAEVLQKKGQQPVVNACHYMRQVALGLQHAHERGMVHRDIKPNNLILMPGPKGQVKILDFGLAKIISERHQDLGLTSDNHYMGTPDYCSPEQAQDARTADIRADLYSMGCTLYCLLAGRPPFCEDTPVGTILAHAMKQPQPLPELRSDVPAELWQVVKRLLAKGPAQRYQKPIDVFRALSAFVKPGAKLDAKSVSLPVRDVEPPVKGTRIAADTGQIKKILREVPRKVPGKPPPKETQAKNDAASPLAIPTGESAAPKKTKEAKESTKPSPRMWSRLWPMLGGAGVLLLVLLGMWASRQFEAKPKTSTQTPAPPSTEQAKAPAARSDEEKIEDKKGEEETKKTVPPPHQKKDIPAPPPVQEVKAAESDKKQKSENIPPPAPAANPPNGAAKLSPPEKKPPSPPRTENKDNARLLSPEEKWLRDVSALPAKQQWQRVCDKLKKLNPDFDFDNDVKKSNIENNVVTDVEIVTDHVNDIHPLKALTGLIRLSCAGSSEQKGKLVDLSPLKDMHIMELDCHWNDGLTDLKPLSGKILLARLNVRGCSRLDDLSPLQGMKLVHLDTGSCARIRDLSPLKGMPLSTLILSQCNQVEDLGPLHKLPLTSLDLRECSRVKNLTPLKGMSLTHLNIHGCSLIDDLSPLQGMKLVHLDAGSCARIRDLSPLKDMPLSSLWLTQCPQVEDLSPLHGMPLTHLSIHGCSGVHDLTPLHGITFTFLDLADCERLKNLPPLHGMKLKHLNLGGWQLDDLTPLRGVHIEHLSLWGCSRIRELEPLQGMPLTVLSLDLTQQVSSLSPLQGMRLSVLSLHGCAWVKDLTPLQGMPLSRLFLHDCDQASDLSPLKEIPLEVITFTPRHIVKGIETIRQMKSLKKIGVGGEENQQFPAEEFWKRWDAGEFRSSSR